MDPEEGGGSPPPRRSRRLQRLDPSLSPPPYTASNQNPSTGLLEDASVSQYGSIYPTQPQAHSTTSVIHDASTIPYIPHDTHPSTRIPPLSTHGSVMPPTPPLQHSNDPPEECYLTRSASPKSSSVQQQTSIYHNHRSTHTHHPPSTIQLQHEHNTSPLSTQHQPPVSVTAFQTLQNTVEHIQLNLNNYQQTTHAQSLSMQNDIDNINRNLQHQQNTMHQTITNAVVAAMQQLQQTNLQTKSSTSPSYHNQTSTQLPPTIQTSNLTDQQQVPTSTNNHTHHRNVPSPTTSLPLTTSNPTSVPTSLASTHTTQAITYPSHITSTTQLHHNDQPELGSQANPITIADLVQMSSAPKCAFPIYTRSQNVFEWKTSCLLELAGSAKPAHRNMVSIDSEGQMIFKSHLSTSDNHELFRMTRKALSNKLDTAFITIDVLNRADGLTLWEMIVEEYRPTPKDQMELDDLKQSFLQLTKLPNELDAAYMERFQQKIKTMEHYDITPSQQQQVIIFLKGLKDTRLTTPILELRQKPTLSIYSDWIKPRNLRHTLERARNYCDLVKQYTPAQPQSRLRTGQLPTVPTRPPNPHSQQPPTLTPPLATSMTAPNIEELKRNFKHQLSTATRPQDVIFEWRNQNRRGCIFHPAQSHKFLKCRVTENICRECNFDNDLSTAIFNSQESTRRILAERANATSNQNQAQDPMPVQPPVAARRTVTAPYSLPPIPTHSSPYEHLAPDDTESDGSHSSLNSSNHRLDPYLYSSNKCSTHNKHVSPTSILNPPKSHKRVSFADLVTSTYLLRQEQLQLQAIPTEINPSTAITDSGATHDMSSHKELFEYLVPFTKPVLATLGDETTTLPVVAYGMMNYCIDNKRVRRIGYFVPKLGTTLISIKQHMKYAGCYFHAENNQVTLAFPNGMIYPSTSPEFTVSITPAKDNNMPYMFDETEAILSNNIKRRKFTVISTTKAPFVPQNQQHQLSYNIKIKKLVPHAHLPKRQTPGSVGFDVHSINDTLIPAHSTVPIHTGLAMAIPKPLYLRIASRSSLAAKGLNVSGGVIDNDYRGEIKVLLHNTTSQPIKISQKDRIAQFIFEVCNTPCMILSNELPSTSRGTRGFGSTNGSATNNTFIPRLKAKMKLRKVSTRSGALRLHQVNNQPDTPVDRCFLPKNLPVPLRKEKSSPSNVQSPPILPEYKVNHSLPKLVRISRDFLSQATGFYNNDNIIKYMPDLGNESTLVNKQTHTPLHDEGHHATMKSKRRNTNPSPLPLEYSDVWHMDIGFGPTTAIGGIRYCLMLVDKATRIRKLYPLKNLTTSLTKAVQQFLTDVGIKPKLLRTDFDKKLIGSDVKELLLKEKIRIESAPPKRQHQNGLVERAWQSAVIMARNWLRSALLPSKFWYFALRRATEISNISPVNLNGIITTPFTAVHKTKVDYRQLFPMFAVSYIKQTTEIGGGHKNKWSSQSLKTICVGTCPDSDGLLFYHPPSKSILSCADNYHFDTFLPAGPQFSQEFDGQFTFTTKSTNDNIHIAPSHELNSVVYVKRDDDNYDEARILQQPFNHDEDAYVVQLTSSGDILHLMVEEIHETNPTDNNIHDDNINSMLPWLKSGSKITIFLPQFLNRPKQGTLHLSDGDGEWYFIPGRSNTRSPILLPSFKEKALSMAHNQKLLQGWVNSKRAQIARHVRITSNILAHHISARHISAKDLINHEAPISLLKHSKLHPKDKLIWDQSYAEEYRGLQSLDTWEVIDEAECKYLQKHNNAQVLPTMTVSVIKRDKDGNPARAKYRIVVLGNLDTYAWEKHDCFAPVLAQHDLRLLVNMAVELQCIPKTGDVSQAFCQSFLPDQELTICKPPPGCNLTPPNSYWKLLKTLYGLKRSPRHWYDKAHSILTAIGLTRSANAPCLYSGSVIPGHPPLYLGLYVDDFIFFSQSSKVEEQFMKSFASHVSKVTFNDEIDFFLGIKFDCCRQNNGHVTIHMSQQAFIENLLYNNNMHTDDINTVQSPYRSGLPIDSIPDEAYDPETQRKYTKTLQSLVGSFTWLSMSTRPDIATITNILAKYVRSPSKGHIEAAKRILRYLKGTAKKGITFCSTQPSNLAGFVKFPIPSKSHITALTDANWGPQDQSRPLSNKTYPDLALYKTRSLSGFIIWGKGPIHWVSKRQTLTARSSAEAEIVATDECTKFLLYLRNICEDLNIHSTLFPTAITVYNDNAACVKWSKNMTTKGLRYIQIRENAVRESVLSNFIEVKHINGKVNLADLFTKEHKDTTHFCTIRDMLVQEVPAYHHSVRQTPLVQGGCQPESSNSTSQVGSRLPNSLPSSHNIT